MAIDPVWFTIEQITRILRGMGWMVVATNTEGPTIKITIEKQKPFGGGGEK